MLHVSGKRHWVQMHMGLGFISASTTSEVIPRDSKSFGRLDLKQEQSPSLVFILERERKAFQHEVRVTFAKGTDPST